MVCPSAKAQTQGGSWQMAIEAQGMASCYTTTNQEPTVMTTVANNMWVSGCDPTNWQPQQYTQGAGTTSATGVNGANATANGKVSYFVRLRWVPHTQQPLPPPTTGALRLESSAYVTARVCKESGTMSLGLTDPSGKDAIVSTPTDSVDGDGTPIKSVTNLSTGKRLLRFDNPNNATELRLGPFNATVDASAMSPEVKKPYPGYPGY